jgi:hypothetical protein
LYIDSDDEDIARYILTNYLMCTECYIKEWLQRPYIYDKGYNGGYNGDTPVPSNRYNQRLTAAIIHSTKSSKPEDIVAFIMGIVAVR